MEISREEKEAIDILKRTIKNSNYCDSIGTGQIEIVLNLIDKLQKENEELKKQLKVNNTFNIKESEVRTPRYIESTTLKRWWLE